MNRISLYIFTIIGLIILAFADLFIGSTYISPGEILRILSGAEGMNPVFESIVWDFRLPRVLTALFVGAGLALSGLLMQVLFRNPLAGPFVLGISTGASLGVAIAVLTGISFGLSWMNSWFTVLAATLGSLLVFMVVMVVSLRVRESMTLLIFGLMLGSATGGIVAILQYFSKAEDIQIYLLWTFGSLGGVTYEKLGILIPMILAGVLISITLIKPLNALILGESYAQSLGVNMFRARIWIIAATCLMAGSVTAFCGPIAFIGIAVPHFARMFFMTSEHKRILPMTLLLGAVALLVCDIISQLPGSDEVLPINAVTAVFGAPIVIWLIIRRGNIKRALG